MLNLTREQWQSFHRACRKAGVETFAPRHDPMVAKADFVALIASKAVSGVVGLSVTQMDCDCSQWTDGEILPATWVAIAARLEEIHNNAEGPVSWGLCHPSEIPSYRSRDLALEAFEEGHPHVVYA